MDKKSKVLISVFAAAVIISVSFIYYHYIVLEDIAFHTDEEAFQESLLEE